jgi:hypothetical protein
MLDYCPENLNSAAIKKISRETGRDFTLHLPEEIDLASFHSSIREGHIKRCKEAIKWSAKADYQEQDILLANEEQIKHLHLHDFKDGTDHQVLFTGDINIEAMISFAKKQNIKIVVEAKTAAALIESVEELKNEVGI